MTTKTENELIRPLNWWNALPREGYRSLEKISTNQSWYSVYRIDPQTLVISEDGQFDENVSYLVMGEKRAALIDTGDNLADLRELVRGLTSLPVFVLNTHRHLDHIGANYLFDEVWAFDHRVSREAAALGVPQPHVLEVIQPGSLCKEIPAPFYEKAYCIPPYRITHWVRDGETIDLGGRTLEAIHTPGHSPDHLCFYEGRTRYLWTGDIFYTGCVYTHLPWGDLDVFLLTYEKLLERYDEFGLLMPSHNDPCIDKSVLREMHALALQARRGEGTYEAGEGGMRKYRGSCFSLVIGEKQADR